MKWGETQNLLSVIIGLNIAYYAFKEMREPHLAALEKRVDGLRERLQKANDDLDIAGHRIPNSHTIRLALTKEFEPILALELEASRLSTVSSSREIESLFGIPAVIIAAVASILLVVSTAKFEDTLSLWAFYPIVIVGFLPVLALLAVNYALLSYAKQKIEREHTRIFSRLYLDILSQLDPYHLIIAEERYKKAHPERAPIFDKTEQT